MARRALSFVCFVLAAMLVPATVHAAGVPLSPNDARAVREQLRIERFDVIRIDAPAAPTATPLDLVVDGPNGRFALALDPHSVRSPSFRLLTRNGAGVVAEVAPPPGATYRGVWHPLDPTQPDAKVAAALTPDGLEAFVLEPSGAVLGIQPLRAVIPGASRELHVLYDAKDVLARVECATPPTPSNGSNSHNSLGGGIQKASAGLMICEIAFEADVAYETAKGSVNATEADTEAILNAVALIYENYVGITYSLTTIIVQTGPTDTYSSTVHDVLLTQFQDYWNQHHDGIARDTAHLMTGKAIQMNVAGYAYIKVVCALSNAYGWSRTTVVSDFATRAAITAHEIGHNWSAQHCDGQPDCGVMCSIIGTCGGGIDKFGVSEQNKITSYRDSVACLDLQNAPLLPPFFDAFQTLEAQQWAKTGGAKVGKKAIGETSGTKSLDLDATSDGTGDALVSQTIDLSALPNAALTFFAEPRGATAGEQLVVEYQNAAADWIALTTLTSDGTVGNTFAQQFVQLPAGALHDAFRARFRAPVAGASHDWYVDDVSVAANTPPATALLCTAGLPAVVATHELGAAGEPANQVVNLGNCGKAGTTLAFTSSEQPASSWCSLTNGASSVTVQFATTGLAAGAYTTFLKVQNNAVAPDSIQVPVTLIVHEGSWFTPGDDLQGTIDASGETDTGSFFGVAGMKLKLSVKTTAGTLEPIVTVFDAAGAVVKSIEFTKSSKAKKAKVTLPSAGLFRVEIAGAVGTDGGYDVKTSSKLPVAARLLDATESPAVSGGPLALTAAGVPGTILSVTVNPVNDGDGPFTVAAFTDPSAAPVPFAPFVRALANGGVQVAGVPLGKAGVHALSIAGFAAKEKVRVTIDPVPPTSANTVVLP